MAWARARKQQQQEWEASPETPRTPPPHASSVQQQQQQSESEVVELGGAGVVGAEHEHAFSRGAILGVGIPGDFEGTAPTPNSSSESMGEEPAVTRPLSLLQGCSARYGASTCPFDPGKGGSLAPARWDCLLYTSPSPRDLSTSRMPSSA